ncbi:hypothetical protein [Microbacterium sp. YY-01]|uniref:hypothetical protein n=1 Tax=Microbacterium sp. YY-01 TaxID=3421634 RepID=UPI003D183C28
MPEVQVQISLYKNRCFQCGEPFWWVLWMRAISPEPDNAMQYWPGSIDEDDGVIQHFAMPVVVENPDAVHTAQRLLENLGQKGRARQLVDRPARARGASYNANQCPRCRHVASWHDLDHLVIEAAHENRLFHLGPAPVSLREWMRVIAAQHNVRGF